jgi:hypothetical protein
MPDSRSSARKNTRGAPRLHFWMRTRLHELLVRLAREHQVDISVEMKTAIANHLRAHGVDVPPRLLD